MIPTGFVPVALVMAVGLIAFFVRGLTGAASAIVANACFLIVIGTVHATALTLLEALYWVALVDVIATWAMAWAVRDRLGLGPLGWRFLIGTVPLSVAFTLVLPRVNVTALGVGLGLAVAAAGIYLFARREAPVPHHSRLQPWAVGAGAAAGVLTGLYGMGGPVSVLFFSRAEADPTQFRALVTSIFVVTDTLRFGVLALDGAYDPRLIVLVVASLPAVALGLFVGFRAHDRLSPGRFRMLLGGLVALAGIVGLLRSLGA